MTELDITEEFEGVEAAHELAGPKAVHDILLVAVGGLSGAVLRYLLDAVVTNRYGSGFPWSTLSINLVGAFLLGLLTVLTLERHILPMYLRPALGIGLLGAFTTFSTYAIDTITLAETGAIVSSITYVVVTNVAGIIAAVCGLALGRFLT